MEINNSLITTVSEDLLSIADRHKNPVELFRCCRDHPEPFLLEDGKPILDISQDQFVGIFDLKHHHYFLPPSQIVRFGVFFKLPLHNLIALMMKSEWELFFDQRTHHYSRPNIDLRTKFEDKNLVDGLISQYQPDCKQLGRLIQSQTNYGKDKTIDRLKFYIDKLLQGQNFLRSNKEVSDLFSEEEISEKRMLSGLSEPQQKAYTELKELYLYKTGEFDQLLLSLECRKKMNLEVENRYFRIFNKLEASKSKWLYRSNKYQLILQLMDEYPDRCYRDLHRMAISRLRESEKTKNEIFDKISRSLNCIGSHGFEGSSNMDDQGFSMGTTKFREDYTKACKKLLRKLFFLLHTDTCPNYDRLSKEDKTEINQLWLKLMKSTEHELYSFSPNMLLYSLPDIEHLQAIYARVCEILELDQDPLEYGNRLEFLIQQGSSLEKLMNFMKEEIDQIEIHMASLEMIKSEYTNEGLTQSYREAILDTDTHSGKLEGDIMQLKRVVADLKLKIRGALIGIEK